MGRGRGELSTSRPASVSELKYLDPLPCYFALIGAESIFDRVIGTSRVEADIERIMALDDLARVVRR